MNLQSNTACASRVVARKGDHMEHAFLVPLYLPWRACLRVPQGSCQGGIITGSCFLTYTHRWSLRCKAKDDLVRLHTVPKGREQLQIKKTTLYLPFHVFCYDATYHPSTILWDLCLFLGTWRWGMMEMMLPWFQGQFIDGTTESSLSSGALSAFQRYLVRNMG